MRRPLDFGIIRGWVASAVAGAFAVILVAGCASGKVAGTDGGPAAERTPPRRDGPRVTPDGPAQPPDFSWPDGPPADGPRFDSTAPDTRPRDTRPPDTLAPDTRAPDLSPTAPNIGAVCTGGPSDPVCVNGAQCLLQVGTNVGICTMSCTQDDPSTTGANEDSCADLARNICGEVPLSDGSSATYCLQRCTPKSGANDCPGELSCSPNSTTITGKLATAACLFPACKTPSDCPVALAKACSATTLTGCSAGETCMLTSDTTAVCTLPGSCDTTNGLCAPHTHGSATAKVGDPCTQDTDCGGAMFCLSEVTTASGVAWRNGYCTIAGCAFPALGAASCPTGSTCSLLYSMGLCLRSCSVSLPADCRGVGWDYLGDYECYAWNNFSIGGKQVAAGPVCDHAVACTLVGGSCESLGIAGNPTAMSCRDPATNQNVTSGTPGSLCLDSTAAGPLGP